MVNFLQGTCVNQRWDCQITPPRKQAGVRVTTLLSEPDCTRYHQTGDGRQANADLDGRGEGDRSLAKVTVALFPCFENSQKLSRIYCRREKGETCSGIRMAEHLHRL